MDVEKVAVLVMVACLVALIAWVEARNRRRQKDDGGPRKPGSDADHP
jgi:hypothetical protein